MTEEKIDKVLERCLLQDQKKLNKWLLQMCFAYLEESLQRFGDFRVVNLGVERGLVGRRIRVVMEEPSTGKCIEIVNEGSLQKFMEVVAAKAMSRQHLNFSIS